MAKGVSKKKVKEPNVFGIRFYMDEEILYIDKDDMISVQGIVTFDGEDGDEKDCIIEMPRTEWLFLQAKYFDLKKKHHINGNGHFETTTGMVSGSVRYKVGTAPLLDEDRMYDNFMEELKAAEEDHEDGADIEMTPVYSDVMVFVLENAQVTLEFDDEEEDD
jgi:hypothetical protein